MQNPEKCVLTAQQGPKKRLTRLKTFFEQLTKACVGDFFCRRMNKRQSKLCFCFQVSVPPQGVRGATSPLVVTSDGTQCHYLEQTVPVRKHNRGLDS